MAIYFRTERGKLLSMLPKRLTSYLLETEVSVGSSSLLGISKGFSPVASWAWGVSLTLTSYVDGLSLLSLPIN